MSEDGKKRALESAMEQIEKSFGRGSIMKLGEQIATKPKGVSVLPTGSLGLDLALGVGGIPKGRIIEVFGPEASGKTTLVLHLIAEVQKSGGTAAFIDAEHALDPVYAKKIGVNVDDLLLSQPDTGEQALQIAETLVRSGAVDLIAIDSVAALTPQAEIEGEMGEQHIGRQARLMSQALRKLAGIISKTNSTVVFTNQLRQKIGILFGNPETTPGGLALKFYASVRLDLRRIATLKKGEEAVGSRVRAKVVKNKVAPPFRQAEFDIVFDRGIDRMGEVVDLGELRGVIAKSGSWYEYKGKKLGQGRDGSRDFLRENPKIAQDVEEEIRKKVTGEKDAIGDR
ncbi:recombinase RecA [candidate division WWE3 bacterium RIFCSPHIGHO2_01_FULL_48_15]|uniref:Protein RecA n=1 Tax=candidate division WWE3 bacterium RIFCSPHIGHO2_01_FULL_48_15 TaxID=1802619 RepID=A0A1F4VC93_UNCKA|nr:MAG: recombinase RecA [candidate division WWE3 bacterium RIFCSPHIGHO2_01_FULL_48_15]